MIFLRLLILALTLASLSPSAHADAWTDIRSELFADRPIDVSGPSGVVLYGPNEAPDGATVPVSVHMPSSMAVKAKTLTLIVDRNPAPVAAVFHLGEAFRQKGEIGDRIIATRIRIDSFSKVRAVLETTESTLLMSEKFIAGAGGCSALPSKDTSEAMANLGRMKVRQSSMIARDADWREAIVMLRHPNFTGMQLDPKTGEYLPARFVRDLQVRVGTRDLFRMVGSISLSENPNIRVTYASQNTEPVIATGTDTTGTEFNARSDHAGF